MIATCTCDISMIQHDLIMDNSTCVFYVSMYNKLYFNRDFTILSNIIIRHYVI